MHEFFRPALLKNPLTSSLKIETKRPYTRASGLKHPLTQKGVKEHEKIQMLSPHRYGLLCIGTLKRILATSIFMVHYTKPFERLLGEEKRHHLHRHQNFYYLLNRRIVWNRKMPLLADTPSPCIGNTLAHVPTISAQCTVP